jgi:phage gp45-like
MRSYTAGGSRSVVDQVDDSKFMQEMAGNFMANETRNGVESPQNYGFTSVVFDAEKDAMGKIKASAETFIGFMGGNRSFPVAGNMDDRRHRMYKLEKGDSAQFRGRGDYQQFHMTTDGGFWTAPQDKTLRMQLLQKDSQSNSTQSQSGAGGTAGTTARIETRDSGTTSSDGSSGQGQQQQKGQEAVYKDGQKSPLFVDITKDSTRVSGKETHLMLDDGKVYVHVASDKKVYLGAKKGEATFARVMTESGPSVNVYAKIG